MPHETSLALNTRARSFARHDKMPRFTTSGALPASSPYGAGSNNNGHHTIVDSIVFQLPASPSSLERLRLHKHPPRLSATPPLDSVSFHPFNIPSASQLSSTSSHLYNPPPASTPSSTENPELISSIVPGTSQLPDIERPSTNSDHTWSHLAMQTAGSGGSF